MATSDTLIRSSDREGEALAPKQARLIRSAYKVMGEKGLRHLSLQDVADEAGVSKALDLMVTGRTVSPSEAHGLGILDRLFPADALEEETRKYAQKLAGGATEAIGSIKLAVYGGIERPLDEGLETERTLVEPLFDSEDAKEGISAFMEKRKPEFSR